MAFNSITFNRIKRGVNKNTRVTEPSKIPSPNITVNKPLSMGFLLWAYGPLVTSLGGGLKGTGVPFTLINCRADHSIRNSPATKTGRDTAGIQSYAMDRAVVWESLRVYLLEEKQ